ncbi:MAG: DUF1778 domain-containing protein [Micrococcales bacterium]|nr:DUF1778 domain-containing protein [Micrococcales bacterium]
MATKTSRLDLRLTDEQRRVVERAAEISGSTISGWSISRLTSAAWDELAAVRATTLPDEAFDQFLTMLDAPEDPRMAELLARAPVWDAQSPA